MTVRKRADDPEGVFHRTCTSCLYRGSRDFGRDYDVVYLICPRCQDANITFTLESEVPSTFWGILWLIEVVRQATQAWVHDLMSDDARLRFALLELD